MKVGGRFTDVDAAVHVAGDSRDSSIQVSVPVHGIDTGSRMRDRDLLKKSVFHADQWPDMCFESTDVPAGADGQFRILGTLRVRDQTKTVEVAAAAADPGPDEYRYTATSRLNPATPASPTRSSGATSRSPSTCGSSRRTRERQRTTSREHVT